MVDVRALRAQHCSNVHMPLLPCHHRRCVPSTISRRCIDRGVSHQPSDNSAVPFERGLVERRVPLTVDLPKVDSNHSEPGAHLEIARQRRPMDAVAAVIIDCVNVCATTEESRTQ
jgi:hypothetical protein